MSTPRLCLFALVCLALLSFGTNTEAQKAKKKKDAPVLGTWTVTIQGQPAPLVFTDHDGPVTAGYFDMNPAGPQKAVAIVGAVLEPGTRTLRLASREIHTNLPTVVQLQVEGVLGPEGKKIDKMKSVINPAAPQGVALWQKEATPPASLPTVAASLADTSDRSLLYQQCSGDFLIDKIRIVHAPVRPLLAELEKSSDKHIQLLARFRRLFQDYFDLAVAQETKERAVQAVQVRGELFKFIDEAFQKDHPDVDEIEAQVGKFMNSDAIQNIFRGERRAALMALTRERAVLAIQREVIADFTARKVPPLEKAEGLKTGFKVDGDGFGSLTLRNTTGRDLHHCFIAPRLRIDPVKMKALEKEFRAKSASLREFTKKFGINMEISDETDEYVIRFHKIDKGSNNYLSEWKQGATVQIDLAQPDAIQRIGASISVWVGSDEGVAVRPIDIAAIKNEIALQQPKELHMLDLGLTTASRDLAFSPSGKLLASAGATPHALVWDVATGQEKGRVNGIGRANAVAFHPSAAIFAVGDEAGKVRLVSLDTMKEVSQPLKHVPPPKWIAGTSVESIAFSKDGKMLASASADKTVKLWNLANGQTIATLEHPSRVHSLAFSPDGATLATGCSDSMIRLWSVAKKETTATYEGHKAPVVALAFHPDGKTLASGGLDGLVKFWTVADGKNPSDLMTNAKNISIAYSPDGKLFAAGGELRGVMIIDPDSGDTLVTLPAATGPVAFSRDGKFATGWRESGAGLPRPKVKIWELPK